MNHVASDVELKRMVRKLREGMRAPKAFLQTEYNMFFEKAERDYYQRELYWRAGGVDERYKTVVIDRINDTRMKSKDLTYSLSRLERAVSVEKFQASVLQLFMVYFLEGHKSKLSKVFLDRRGVLGEFEASKPSRILPFFASVGYISIVGGLGIVTFTFGASMGSKSTPVRFPPHFIPSYFQF
jgi:hypothetical protein